ncbi:MAG: inositol monophosphatase family protein [Oleiphilaceae bacterium]|nr:inositol monophosphatase family protein [Oleiphilaceae bacterium]
MQPILNIALRAARQSSEYIVQAIDRREPANGSLANDLQLIAHLEEVIYNALYDAMKRAHPTHFIAKPGETPKEGKDDVWIVHAIHSPHNLLRKLPETAFSITHWHKGKVQNALVINPITGEEFSASRGSGAALNGRRIRSTAARSIDSTLLLSNTLNQVSGASAPHAVQGLVNELSAQVERMYVGGCDTLDICRVAAGQADALLSLNVELSETTASLMIAREAGMLSGTLTGDLLKGGKSNLVAANPKLFKALVQRFAGWEAKAK